MFVNTENCAWKQILVVIRMSNPLIYGVEFQVISKCFVKIKLFLLCFILNLQARSLCSLHADVDQVSFLIGTQSLNTPNNQVHLVKLHEDTNTLSPQVCISIKILGENNYQLIKIKEYVY